MSKAINSSPMKYDLKWRYATMDDWQRSILSIQGNLILLCGRQVGKSEIIAYLEALYLLNTPKSHLLIVSGVERQASGLYRKILALIEEQYPHAIAEEKPLRTVFKLKNGAICRTEPLGTDGSGARQHTLTRLVIEEMQLVSEEAYAAITPMLLTTGGDIHMLGTAWSTEGYVYERLSDPAFSVVRVNAEEVAEKRPEPQRSFMLKHLENERKRLSEAHYMQEYLAIPSDKVRQIFPDSLIKKVLCLKRTQRIPSHRHVCGVDPAGLGEDEGCIAIFDTEDKNNVEMRDLIITKGTYTTDITKRIKGLDTLYDFEKIYVDDGGVGFGVFSELINDDSTRNRVIPMNNATYKLDYREDKNKQSDKITRYINLLRMMERGEIKLLDDPEIRESLKSCKFDKSEKTGKLIITSSYNHPAEAISRGCWDAEKKDLNLSVHSIKV